MTWKLRSRVGSRSRKEADLAYLHISKTGGTQIKLLFEQIANLGVSFKAYAHLRKLTDISHQTPYFFSIRGPVSRFVSGFYERKRAGGSAYANPWSQHEALAFARFEHANRLAEDLLKEGEVGRLARKAIGSISHTASHQVDQFSRAGYFLSERPPVAIVRQEFFEDDLQLLLERLGLRVSVQSLLTHDPSKARITDYKDVPRLSALAIKSIETWYKRDMWFYRDCESWIRDWRP